MRTVERLVELELASRLRELADGLDDDRVSCVICGVEYDVADEAIRSTEDGWCCAGCQGEDEPSEAIEAEHADLIEETP